MKDQNPSVTVESSLAQDLSRVTLGKTLELPQNIKDEIKSNVEKLKVLLKAEPEFCIELIKLIVDTGKFMWPSYIVDVANDHYRAIREQCNNEHKACPPEVDRVPHIAGFLSHLISGFQPLIGDAANDIASNSDRGLYATCEILGELARTEISTQFNPDIDYRIPPEQQRMYEEAYEAALAGQRFEDSEDL